MCGAAAAAVQVHMYMCAQDSRVARVAPDPTGDRSSIMAGAVVRGEVFSTRDLHVYEYRWTRVLAMCVRVCVCIS